MQNYKVVIKNYYQEFPRSCVLTNELAPTTRTATRYLWTRQTYRATISNIGNCTLRLLCSKFYGRSL